MLCVVILVDMAVSVEGVMEAAPSAVPTGWCRVIGEAMAYESSFMQKHLLPILDQLAHDEEYYLVPVQPEYLATGNGDS